MVGAGFAQQAAAAPPAVSPGAAAEQVNQRALATRVTFDGPYQAGILTPKPDEATFVALDSVAPNRAVLFEALQALSTEARLLTQGDTVGLAEIDDPPPDSGILGPVDSPDSLTVTIALGGSLFDGRYGLAAARPRHLTAMPVFANDELDPARTGGDVLAADLRRTARHRHSHVPRADARGRRAAGRAVDDRRVPVGAARAVGEEQPPQPVRVPRRNRRTPTSPIRRR